MNKCYITMLYSNESSFYYEFNYVFIISWSCKMKDFNGFLKMFRLSVSVKYTAECWRPHKFGKHNIFKFFECKWVVTPRIFDFASAGFSLVREIECYLFSSSPSHMMRLTVRKNVTYKNNQYDCEFQDKAAVVVSLLLMYTPWCDNDVLRFEVRVPILGNTYRK